MGKVMNRRTTAVNADFFLVRIQRHEWFHRAGQGIKNSETHSLLRRAKLSVWTSERKGKIQAVGVLTALSDDLPARILGSRPGAKAKLDRGGKKSGRRTPAALSLTRVAPESPTTV